MGSAVARVAKRFIVPPVCVLAGPTLPAGTYVEPGAELPERATLRAPPVEPVPGIRVAQSFLGDRTEVGHLLAENRAGQREADKKREKGSRNHRVLLRLRGQLGLDLAPGPGATASGSEENSVKHRCGSHHAASEPGIPPPANRQQGIPNKHPIRLERDSGLLLAPTGPLSDVDLGLIL